MDNQIENQVDVQPNNQKSGKGKTVAIIILTILLLGAVAYIAYDKVLNKENENYKNEVQDLKNQLNSLKTENTQLKNSVTEQNTTTDNQNAKTDNNGYIDAVYSISNTDYTSTVVLFKSGKCVSNSHMEYNLCTYDIKGDKLNLHFKGSMLSGDGNPYTETYNILKHDMMEFIKITDGSNNDELKRLQ